MKNSLFLVFCLVIFSGWLAVHALLRDRLSPVEMLQAKIEILNKQKQDADFRAQLAAHQLADYQQHVATLLPGAIKGKSFEESYPLRQLASVIGSDTKVLPIERASSLFEKAKASFRDKLYEDSNEIFSRLIETYPESVHAVEAHFLLAEGQFQLAEYEAAIITIEKMINIFPESELTGFALLRLGQIFERQERLEDASDIYRAVEAGFQHPDLKKQAQAALRAVAL